jgi:hypothetical protein
MTTTALIWHAAQPGGLRRLGTTVGPAGVVLGRQHSGELAPVRLFRPEPTRVTLVSGSWLAWLVVFRSLGVGAQVHVTTAAPARWSTVGGLAGLPDLVTVGATPPTETPGSMRPRLWVNDVGLGAESAAVGPWETMLDVVPGMTPTAPNLLAEADVVLLQRLTPDDADVCASTLRLAAGMETKLSQLHDDLVVVVVAGAVRFVNVATTPTEEELLGPPRRD